MSEISIGPYRGAWGKEDAIPVIGPLIHGLRGDNFTVNKYEEPARNRLSCTVDAIVLGAYNGCALLGTSALIHSLYS